MGAAVRQGGWQDSGQRIEGVDAVGVRVGRRFLPHIAQRPHHPAHIGVPDLHQGAGRAAQRGDGLHDRRIVQHHALPVRVHAHGDAPVHPEPHFAEEVGPLFGAAGIGEVRRARGASVIRYRWRVVSAGGGQHHHPERIVRLDGIREEDRSHRRRGREGQEEEGGEGGQARVPPRQQQSGSERRGPAQVSHGRAAPEDAQEHQRRVQAGQSGWYQPLVVRCGRVGTRQLHHPPRHQLHHRGRIVGRHRRYGRERQVVLPVRCAGRDGGRGWCQGVHSPAGVGRGTEELQLLLVLRSDALGRQRYSSGQHSVRSPVQQRAVREGH